MKLSDYLSQKSLKTSVFAKQIGITPQALGRYLAGQRIPVPPILWRIEAVTKGAVTANDFHQHYRSHLAAAE
jgi:transcriptional regulator with XRE-family HTH domain